MAMTRKVGNEWDEWEWKEKKRQSRTQGSQGYQGLLKAGSMEKNLEKHGTGVKR